MPFNYRPGDEPVPGYRLVRFLGKGAIGEVWQATGPGGTEAALKMIDLTGSGPHARKEFRALQLVKRIHHPNLTPIIAFWAKSDDGSLLEDTDAAQLSMPLEQTYSPVRQTMMVPTEPLGPRPKELIIAMGLGHKSLADRLAECQQEGLPGILLDELLGYMADAAKAIDFLNSPVHQLESGTGAIGHCDIKPLNILVVGGAAQVCDFGLAHIVGAARSTAAAMGTIAYVAPELLEGKPSNATDQYCLAISYYELRSGALPYAEETASAVMKAVIEGNLDFSKIPEAEQSVLRKATAKSPGDRFPSAAAMVAALGEATAAASGQTRALAGRRGRSPVAAMLKTIGVLVLLGVVALGAWLGVSSDARDGFRRFLAGGGNGGNGGNGGAAVEPVKPPEAAPTPEQELAAKLGALLSQGADLAAKNDWQSAVAKYDEVLALDPDNRRGLLMRARCSLRLGQYDAAVAYLRKVQPPDAETGRAFLLELAGVGEAAMKKQNWESARDALRRALELDPRNVAVLILLGRTCLGQDRPDDAAVHLDRAIELEPNSADAHFYRGCAWLAKQQYDKALAEFDLLMQKLDPENRLGYASRKEYGEAYLGLGTALRDQGAPLLGEAAASDDAKKEEAGRAKIQQAVDQFTKAIFHDPRNALLWSRRGTSLLQLDKLGEAEADLTKAIEFGTRDVDMYLLYRGTVYEKMALRQKADPQAKAELFKKAAADFSAAAAKNPGNADAEYLLAECCSQLDDFKGAIAAYDAFIQRHPQWSDPWFTLKTAYYYRGNCHLSVGNLTEAAADFTKATATPGDLPDDPDKAARAFHKLAAELAKLKQFADAIRWNQQAIALTPDEATKEQFREAEKAWKP